MSGGWAYKITSPEGEVAYVPFQEPGDAGRPDRVVHGSDWTVDREPIFFSDDGGDDLPTRNFNDWLAWETLP